MTFGYDYLVKIPNYKILGIWGNYNNCNNHEAHLLLSLEVIVCGPQTTLR